MPQTGKPLGSMVIKLGLDGSKFTDTLANIQRSLKTQLSTMRANLKVYDAVGDNLGKLENNYKDLKSTIALLEKENEHLTASYKKHVEAGTENSKAAQNLAKKINDNIQKQALYRKQLSQTERALADEKSGMNDLREEISRVEQSTQALVQKNKAMGRSLAANKEEYNGLKTVIDKRNQLIDKEKAKLAELIRTKGRDDSATAEQRLAIQKLEAAQAEAIERYKKLERSIGNVSDYTIKLKEKLSDISGKLSESAEKANQWGDKLSKAFTLPIAALSTLGTKISSELSNVSGKIQAMTGVAGKEARKQGKIVGQVWADGFGESTEQVGEAVVKIKQNLNGISDKQLKSVTEKALTLSKITGADLDESLRGVNSLMTNFGMSADEAFDYMVTGAQRGLNKSGELEDNISEYGQLWAQAGFSAKDMFSILENGLKSGAYNFDKVNDFVKEFGISLNDGRFQKNIGSFSERTQELFDKYKSGKATVKDVFGSAINDLKNMRNEHQKLSIASTVWSSLGEDNAMKVIESLNNTNKAYDNVSGAAKKAAKSMNDTPVGKFNKAWRKFQTDLKPVGDDLLNFGTKMLPKVSDAINKVTDKFENLSPSTRRTVLEIAGFAAALGPTVKIGGMAANTISKMVNGYSKLRGVISKTGNIMSKMFGGLGIKNAIKLQASLAWGKVKTALSAIGKAGKATGKFFKWSASLLWSGVKKSLSALQIAGKKTGKAFVWTGKIAVSGAKKAIQGIGTAARVSGRWIGIMTKAAFNFGKTSAIWAAQRLKILAVAAAQKVAAGAAKAWAVAQRLLNLAMKANPIGLVITAVATLAIGLVSLYKHSKKFRDFVNGIKQKAKEMANSVKSHVSGMVSGVKSKFSNMKNTAVKLAGSMANQVSNKHSWLNKHTNGAARSMFNGLKKTYHSGHKTLENATQTFRHLVSGKWSKLGGDIKRTTKSALNTAKNYYKSGFSALNKLTGGRLGNMFSKVKSFSSKVVSTFKSLPHKIASGIKNGARTIANAGKHVGNSLLRAIGKPVNGVIKGVNWVLKRVGAKHLIKHWHVPQYAKGTGGHPQDGPMIVGDGNGAHRKELIQFPNGKTFLSPDRPTMMFAPKGTQVVDGDNTKKIMTLAGIPKYASGIGWLKDKIAGGWGKLKNIGDNIWKYVSHPTKLLNTVVERYAGSSIANLAGAMRDIASGSAKLIIKNAASWIKNMFGSTANPSGSGVQRWRPYVIRALAMNGLSTSKSMVNKVLRQIATESGGNPLAVQHGYTDINTITGDLAKGLMQTISATFNAYKFPGHGNIFNGFDNLLAALNYAKHRYGKTLSALGKGHGYANGGLVTTEQIAKIGEGNKAEMVIPLTNKTRAIQLMMQALAILGGNSSSVATTGRNGAGTVDMTDTNNLLKQLINLVASIDPNVYLDGKKLYDNNKKYSNQEANIRNVFKGVMSIG